MTLMEELVMVRKDIMAWDGLRRDFPHNSAYAMTYNKLVVREAELVRALNKEYFGGKV